MSDYVMITCGCGFKVNGVPAEVAQQIFEDHPCFEEGEAPKHWLGYVFSWPTALIVFFAGPAAIDVIQELNK